MLSRQVPLHQQAEKVVDSALIAASGGFQPGKNVRIETNGYSLFLGPIEPADDIVRWNFLGFQGSSPPKTVTKSTGTLYIDSRRKAAYAQVQIRKLHSAIRL